jgi:hypothetical protein
MSELLDSPRGLAPEAVQLSSANKLATAIKTETDLENFMKIAPTNAARFIQTAPHCRADSSKP